MEPLKIGRKIRQLVRSLKDDKAGPGSNLIDDPLDVAARLKQKVYRPGSDECFIDLDDEAAVQHYHLAMDTFKINGFPLVEKRFEPSKTPGHYHAVVGFPTRYFQGMTPVERLAIQCILGSDRKANMWSMLRILTDHPDPVLLFETEPIWMEDGE